MEYKGYQIEWQHDRNGGAYVEVFLDGECRFSDDNPSEACKEIDRILEAKKDEKNRVSE